MKLTKEMFDFEKYEYRLGRSSFLLGEQVEAMDDVSGEWFPGSYRPGDVNLVRKLKPPPRYILLNEGEKLQAGDEVFFNSTKDWCLYSTITREVLPGEIWRREDTTK